MLGLGSATARGQVTRENVPGITNFAHVETTIACAGATAPEAVAAVKQLGYASIINLRQASEAGANLEAEERRRRPRAFDMSVCPSTGRRPIQS